jgi:hypothetical protein
MPLAKDVPIELESLKTVETPRLTPILLSSSLDPLIREMAETIHRQKGPRPFTLSQNILLKKRGRSNSIITLERLQLSRLALFLRF